MAKDSGIQWTHHTFNPWWGCARVSPGCEHCYAETFAKRTGHKVWGVQSPRRMFGDKHWNEPLAWDRAAAKAGERHRVFCASMADVFEDREELHEPRARLWRLIGDTPSLDWLLLTKRPENADRLARAAALHAWDGGGPDRPTWLPNVWLGTTVEDQKRADERIPHLLDVPAKVRFLSCEPLLESVNISQGIHCDGCGYSKVDKAEQMDHHLCARPSGLLDWVIIGGESGPGARPFDVSWARSLVRQCRAAGVAPFVKQMGSHPIWNGIAGPGEHWPDHVETTSTSGHGWRVRLQDGHGGDMAEWPEDLRVREFPEVRP